MPDTSSSSSPITTTVQAESTDDLASLYKELYTAEKTADALEGRLDGLEKRLDELLEALESKEKELEAAKSKTKAWPAMTIMTLAVRSTWNKGLEGQNEA